MKRPLPCSMVQREIQTPCCDTKHGWFACAHQKNIQYCGSSIAYINIENHLPTCYKPANSHFHLQIVANHWNGIVLMFDNCNNRTVPLSNDLYNASTTKPFAPLYIILCKSHTPQPCTCVPFLESAMFSI